MAKTNLTYWYHLIAIITVIIWGTTFVSTKVLIHHGLSPVDILFYRFALAYICIWFISPKVLFARSKKDELMFVAAGLCGGSIYFITENTALGITLASNVSLIICTAPILTAFLSLLFYRQEKIKPNLIYGSVMALIGVAFVVFNGSFLLKINPLGDMLTLSRIDVGVLLPDTETDGEPLSDIADYAESVFLRACHADADVSDSSVEYGYHDPLQPDRGS